MDIGARLQTLRKQRNISGKALAQKVGVVPSQIYKIESNTTKPSFDTLEKICDVLGISIAEFFTEESPDLPPDLQQLVQEAKDLAPKQRKMLVEFIKCMKNS